MRGTQSSVVGHAIASRMGNRAPPGCGFAKLFGCNSGRRPERKCMHYPSEGSALPVEPPSARSEALANFFARRPPARSASRKGVHPSCMPPSRREGSERACLRGHHPPAPSLQPDNRDRSASELESAYPESQRRIATPLCSCRSGDGIFGSAIARASTPRVISCCAVSSPSQKASTASDPVHLRPHHAASHAQNSPGGVSERNTSQGGPRSRSSLACDEGAFGLGSNGSRTPGIAPPDLIAVYARLPRAQLRVEGS